MCFSRSREENSLNYEKGSVIVATTIVAILVMVLLGMTRAPADSSTTTLTQTATSGTGSTTASGPGPLGGPGPLAGVLFAGNVSCSLGTGTCAITLINNSTIALEVTGCRMSVALSSSDGTVTSLVSTNGTIGGPASISDIQGKTQSKATCSIPTSDLVVQPKGSVEDGVMTIKLLSRYYGSPAGSETHLDFEGAWS